jgi:hypothetical protein
MWERWGARVSPFLLVLEDYMMSRRPDHADVWGKNGLPHAAFLKSSVRAEDHYHVKFNVALHSYAIYSIMFGAVDNSINTDRKKMARATKRRASQARVLLRTLRCVKKALVCL